MNIGLDLIKRGRGPLLCEEVSVVSRFPEHKQAQKTQRTRWEHGHLATIFAQAPRLLFNGIKRRNLVLVAMALDLAIPPLSLLILFMCAITVLLACVVVLFIPNSVWLLAGSLVPLAILVGAVLSAWICFARKMLPFRYVLRVPLFVLMKVPVYMGFFRAPEKKWIKTERDKN